MKPVSYTHLDVYKRQGHVGAGLGKATEIPEAIRKGKEDAMKKMIEITFDENGSITHDVLGKMCIRDSCCNNRGGVRIMANIQYYDVILKPVITEKSMDLMADKKYTCLLYTSWTCGEPGYRRWHYEHLHFRKWKGNRYCVP